MASTSKANQQLSSQIPSNCEVEQKEQANVTLSLTGNITSLALITNYFKYLCFVNDKVIRKGIKAENVLQFISKQVN